MNTCYNGQHTIPIESSGQWVQKTVQAVWPFKGLPMQLLNSRYSLKSSEA